METPKFIPSGFGESESQSGSPRPRRQHGWIPEKALFLAGRRLPPSCALTRWTQSSWSGGGEPNHLLKTPPPCAFIFRLQHTNLGGGAHKQLAQSQSLIRTQSCTFPCVFSRMCLCYQGAGGFGSRPPLIQQVWQRVSQMKFLLSQRMQQFGGHCRQLNA